MGAVYDEDDPVILTQKWLNKHGDFTLVGDIETYKQLKVALTMIEEDDSGEYFNSAFDNAIHYLMHNKKWSFIDAKGFNDFERATEYYKKLRKKQLQKKIKNLS